MAKFLDERAPTGYKHCLDDRLMSAGAGKTEQN